MIKRDDYGFLVDPSEGDGGDSANRAGLVETFGGLPDSFEMMSSYEVSFNGILVRHPNQAPWNNPKNFSRDQLVPFMAGLHANDYRMIARRVFWSRLRNFFFAQNTERDYPGTTKYPWPHEFVNFDGNHESKKFDFADPLPPDVIWHMILCAKLKCFYWFAPIGYLWFALALIGHCRFNKSDDEGQIICQAVVAGKPFVKLYKKLKPDWKESLDRYWGGWRDNQEIADLIKQKL